MNNTWLENLGRVGLIASLAVAGSRGAIAQIVPDSTLGNENSVVVPINTQLEQIQGGALRGSNLFHSFQEFNVQNGHSAYFVNPVVVENIFSRVTGANVSEILGTLGVLGEANLYLINPNGIIFGENASLDIKGSFVATTASSLVFGDGSEYSAVNPEIPAAIVNNVPIQISLQFEGEPATIVNLGNLSTGESLTLAGGNLDLEGELVAGEDLTLTAEDTVKIRDEESDRFVAAAGNNLLVQGNEGVDIFALNHAESGLFSGGDMILRSNNAVIGDAHYYSGGSFRIEELDGNLGELESPNDPVIRVQGDVFMNAYEGASLHIFAGGKVEIPGYIWITGMDSIYGLTETVTLSDGSVVEIDGKSKLTLDIRAGVNSAFIGSPIRTGTGFFFNPSITSTPSSSEINIGDIFTTFVSSDGGKGFLTNQYKPNTALQGGITVNSVDLRDVFGGGALTIDSRNEIIINRGVDVSALDLGNNNYQGNGGNLNMLANNDISLNSGGFLISAGNLGGNINLKTVGNILVDNADIASVSYNYQFLGETPTAGNIVLDAESIFLDNGTRLAGITFGQANTGYISLNATKNIRLQGENSQGITSEIFNRIASIGQGDAGDINIQTRNLELLDGAGISSITLGQGNLGNIILNITDNFRIQGENQLGEMSSIVNQVRVGGEGNGGEININVGNLELLDGAIISTSMDGKGNLGNINISVEENLYLQGQTSWGSNSAILSQLSFNSGSGGEIKISTNNLELFDGAIISTSTDGKGNAGNLTINVIETLRLQGESGQGFSSEISSQVTDVGEGNGGNIEITTKTLELLEGAGIFTDTFGKGNAGNITINVIETLRMQGEDSQGRGSSVASGVTARAEGNGGNIKITAETLEILGGAIISAVTLGKGNAGNIIINATDNLRLQGQGSRGISQILSGIRFNGEGTGGEIHISTETLELLNGTQISTSTSGIGNAGKIIINATETLRLQGQNSSRVGSVISSQVLSFFEVANNGVVFLKEGEGNGGEINITAGSFELLDLAAISTSTRGKGIAGSINISANAVELADGSEFASRTYNSFNAGNITLNVIDRLKIEGENSGLFTNTEPNSTGNGGDIFLQTDNLFLNNNAQISAATEGQGKAGNLNITAHTLEANNGSQLRTNTSTSKDAGDITLNIANNVRLTGNNTGLFAQTQGAGNAGEILVNTPELNLLQGAIIRASTSDRGNSGDITVNAPTSIFLGGNSQLSVETSNAGKAGNITLTTPNLTVEELARITATATATATTQQQGGSITVNASQINLAGTVGIFAETQGQVPAGILTLQPDNNQNNLDINFQQGAQISASTSGSGTGGSLFVFAPDTIDISGDGTLAVETSSTGNAGNIEMRAANLNLSNGAKISASTSGEGQGGNIDLAIARHIQLSDRSTGIIASTAADSRGNGGNINIQTAYLNAADGVEIGVNSQGMGTGGDIDITADRINLNNSQITAETRSTQGGNINLTVRDLLLMRHGSKISTTAGTAQAGGDGGNITINAENGFLVGPTGEDNDITANAFEGNGGNINITAQEIFGLKFRDELTPRSDITASSEFGLDGIVQLNTLGIDPNNGLTNLPEDQNDPEVRQGCSQGGANSSSLTVQGIGGAPDNPDDMLTPEIDDEFISLDELETDGTIAENEIALLDEKRSPLAFSCQ